MDDLKSEIACPHCNKTIALDCVAKLKEKHRIAFAITPTPGEYINTRTLGDTCTNFGKMLEAIGRDLGAKTHVLVERIETDEAGQHTIHCLITRVLVPEHKAKRARQPAPEGE